MVKAIRLHLALSLIVYGFPISSYSYDDTRQAFYQPALSNPYLPHLNPSLNPDITRLTYDKLNISMIPGLNLSLRTSRLPTFNVQDFGDSIWTHLQPNMSFDDNQRLSNFSSMIETPNQSQISFDFSNASIYLATTSEIPFELKRQAEILKKYADHVLKGEFTEWDKLREYVDKKVEAEGF